MFWGQHFVDNGTRQLRHAAVHYPMRVSILGVLWLSFVSQVHFVSQRRVLYEVWRRVLWHGYGGT